MFWLENPNKVFTIAVVAVVVGAAIIATGVNLLNFLVG